MLVHVDAAQAAGHVPIDFATLGADLLSVSAHKLGGPAGVGALLVRRGPAAARRCCVGGDQERARRAGLENVPAIVGLRRRVRGAGRRRRSAPRRAEPRRLTDAPGRSPPVAGLDGVPVYGDPDEPAPPPRVPRRSTASSPRPSLLGLDQAGVAVHSGSACASEALEPSPVLEAMGVDAHHSLRLSVGWSTTDDDIDRLLDALPRVLADLRGAQ